jgi:uncharacterized membrane protein required for colicin V production
MVSLTFMFWLFVILFGIIGAMRGWAKELLVSFSMILALAFLRLLESNVPFIERMVADPNSGIFWMRTIIVLVLVFFGYQTVAIPRFASKAAREKLQDALLGFVFGAFNGYLVVGSLWFYVHEAGYPFSRFITAPDDITEMGRAALELIPYLAPRLLGEPTIYFAVILSFIFVLVVFI